MFTMNDGVCATRHQRPLTSDTDGVARDSDRDSKNPTRTLTQKREQPHRNVDCPLSVTLKWTLVRATFAVNDGVFATQHQRPLASDTDGVARDTDRDSKNPTRTPYLKGNSRTGT